MSPNFILFLVLLMFGGVAMAEGPTVADCRLAWGAPTSGGPVEGYRVYVGPTADSKTARFETSTTSADCSDLGLTEGQQYAHVTAFNAAGESGGTNTVPFFVVTQPPGAPTDLQVQ